MVIHEAQLWAKDLSDHTLRAAFSEADGYYLLIGDENTPLIGSASEDLDVDYGQLAEAVLWEAARRWTLLVDASR